MPPETCPNCGADVPRNAKACSECGSDESTGWSDSAAASGGLDLPDEDFSYDEFVKEEFGRPKLAPKGIKWYWWIVALALSIGLIMAFVPKGLF